MLSMQVASAVFRDLEIGLILNCDHFLVDTLMNFSNKVQL